MNLKVVHFSTLFLSLYLNNDLQHYRTKHCQMSSLPNTPGPPIQRLQQIVWEVVMYLSVLVDAHRLMDTRPGSQNGNDHFIDSTEVGKTSIKDTCEDCLSPFCTLIETW